MPPLSPVISPAPPAAPSVSLHRPASSEHTPSADPPLEEEQPTAVTPQTLGDMFSFDIEQFLDEEDEDITSKAKSPISKDLKQKLQDIVDRLNSSLDFLVTDYTSVRMRFQEIQDQLPDELNDVLSLAVFLEQHQLKLQRAKQTLTDRLERKSVESAIQTSRQQVNTDKAELDKLTIGLETTQKELDALRQEEADLLAKLKQTRMKIAETEQKLTDLPQLIETQNQS